MASCDGGDRHVCVSRVSECVSTAVVHNRTHEQPFDACVHGQQDGSQTATNLDADRLRRSIDPLRSFQPFPKGNVGLDVINGAQKELREA